MRAVLCKALGDESGLVIGDVDAPVLRPNGVKIRVRAAGLNFADGLMIAGTYQNKPALPFTPGVEVGGEVLEIAPGVTTCQVGDRVMAVTGHGGFAEQAIADANSVYKIPASMGWDDAAGFPVTWGTSLYGLDNRARLKPGETLLVHGGGSGVGLTAVAVGHALGARVIATARGTDKLAAAQAHGADELIDYSREDIRERVKALTGERGADVVYDPVGGSAFEASMRCTAPGGRILIIGFASGTVPQIPANILLVKNITVIGYVFGAYLTLDPTGMRTAMERALTWFADGKIGSHITERLPLDQAAKAIGLMKRRAITGKIVLMVD
jgi:NADPH2:quinone reductase